MKKILVFIASLFFTASSISMPASAIVDARFFSSNNILFYDDECQSESNASAVLLAGNDNTEKILNFFMRKGLSLAQASGIVGNIMQESGLKPDIEQGGRIVDSNYTPKNGVGFGLVQWTFTDRQAPLVQYTKNMGVPITDLGGQLGYIWEELNGSYLTALNNLRSTDDPVESAVAFHDGYERSADSPGQVRSVRGGNAQKIYDQYKDAPALAGATADDSLQNPGGSPDNTVNQATFSNANNNKRSNVSCSGTGFAGGNFNETLKHYAWSEWKGLDTEPKPEYKEAFTKAKANGYYIGGISHPGIDCGGFVTLLIRDSGFDKGYNYDGKGGSTTYQQKWASENWETLGDSASIDPASLQPGDVAINSGHTFIFVGDVPGFESKIASASLDERAPMADTQQQATQPGFTWYRKK